MGIRDAQRAQRRLDILYAALDLFVRKGYTATKISDIAKSVNMSTGLLFHYFESKEKLYEELVITSAGGAKVCLSCEFSEPMEFFRGFSEMLFTYIKERPKAAKMFVLIAQARQSDATPLGIRKIVSENNMEDSFTKLIVRGQENGTIRRGNAYALSMAFWGAICGIMENYAANPDIPLPEADWVCDILREKC